MNASALIYLFFAILIGAQWGGMASVSVNNVAQGAGLFIASLAGMSVGSFVLAKVLATFMSPKNARDRGIFLGIVGTGAAILAALHSLGATTTAMGKGAAVVGSIALIIIGYEAYLDIQKYRTAERVQAMLEKGQKETYNNNYEAAEEIYREAILAAEMGLGTLDLRTIVAVRHLADMYRAMGQSHRCSRLFRRCVGDFERMLDPPSRDYASALFGLAEMYKSYKDLRNCFYYAKRALSVLEYDAGANPLLQVRVLKLLASIFAQAEDYQKALGCGEAACQVLADAGLDAQKAALAGNLVDFMIKLGQLSEAEAKIEELMAERQRLGLTEDGVVAQLLMSKARLLEQKGQDASALKVEALEVVRRSGGPDYPQLPKALEDVKQLILDPARCSKGHPEFFQGLISGMTNKSLRALDTDDALLNAADGSGWVPLQWAAFYGKETLVEALLERGANVNVGAGELTPLHIASRWGHTKVMSDLLDRGGDVHARDRFGNTPLHAAASSPANRAVDLLVSQGSDPNVVNEAGYTAMHLAALNGRTRMIIDLVGCEANVNAKNPKTGETPLHLAVKMGHRGATQGLLLSGADKNIRDGGGKSAWALAKASGRDDIIAVMKEG